MRALFARELVAASKVRALAAAICAYASVCSTFVLVWHGGVPEIGGVFSQTLALQYVFSAAAVSWLVARCLEDQTPADVARAAAHVGRLPGPLVIAKVGAAVAIAALVVAAGGPSLDAARRIDGVAAPGAIADVAALGAFAAFVATVQVLAIIVAPARLPAWLAAVPFTAAAVWLALAARDRPFIVAATAAATAAAIGSAAAWWGNRRLVYIDRPELARGAAA